MPVIEIKNAERLVTMDTERREIIDGTVIVKDQRISFVGSDASARQWLSNESIGVDQTIDASGCVVLPG